MEPKSPLVVVLSMERSGTSALTECLSLLGYRLSPERHLMGATKGNPHGFFEDLRPFELSKKLLRRCGATTVTPWPVFACSPTPEEIATFRALWQRMQRERITLLKDPKYCVTLPWWRQVWPEDTVYVIIGRHPLEVAQSMLTRSKLPLPHGLIMWHVYMEKAFAYTEGLPRVYAEHEALIRDPQGEMRRVAEELHAFTGVPVPDPFPQMPIEPALHREVATGPAPLPAIQAFWETMQETLKGDPRLPVSAPPLGEAELREFILLFSDAYAKYRRSQMQMRRQKQAQNANPNKQNQPDLSRRPPSLLTDW